jgi:hypothetical protein
VWGVVFLTLVALMSLRVLDQIQEDFLAPETRICQ